MGQKLSNFFLAIESARWKTGMQLAIDRGEAHWDRKMEGMYNFNREDWIVKKVYA